MHDQAVDVEGDPRLETAFGLLREIVVEMHANGRRAYAASVKPRLADRTNGGFDVRTLGPGFASFRAFLDAAADAGVVVVTPAPVGPDVELLPIGATTLGPRDKPDHRRRIRRDLWRAFLDWTPGRLRAYDRERNRVIDIPADAAPLEPAGQAGIRITLSDQKRFVPIPAIAEEEQRAWMEAFVKRAPPSRAIPMLELALFPALELALASPQPFRAFSRVLAADPATLAEFNDYRLTEVSNHISSWITEHGLQLDIFDPRSTVAEDPQHARVAEDGHAARLRRAVHAAVDRMPPEALKALHIPIEFLVEP